MTLDQLRAFVTAVDDGSLTGAAKRLGLTQSTVSFHVATLEAHLGARLLDRGRGGVAPTHAGRVLLPDARALLSLAADAVGRVRADGANPAGEVVVAASTIPATYLLPDVLARLRAEAPRVDVSVRESDSARATEALLRRECQIALIGAPSADPRLLERDFASDEIVLVGLPDAAIPGAGDPFVVREPGSGTRRATEHLVPGGGARVVVGSTEAARRCVLAGLGCTFLSHRAAAEDLAAGRLVVVPLAGTPVHRSFRLARLRSVTPSPAVRALLRVLSG